MANFIPKIILSVANWLSKGSQYLMVLGVAAASPSLLAAHNRLGFGYISEELKKDALVGFSEEEEELLNRLNIRSGSALSLACGTGREVFAFAQRGFLAVGLEQIAAFVEFAKNLKSENHLKFEFLQGDMGQFDFLAAFKERPFDCITLFNIAYSYLPSQIERVKLLSKLRQILKPSGYCLVHFFIRSPSSRERRWHPTLKTLGRVINRQACFELGNRLQEDGRFFLHCFPSADCVREEALKAGFHEIDFFTTAPATSCAILKA